LYGLTWTDNHIIFTVDNEEIGDVWAPENGIWYYRRFQNNPGGTNLSQDGNWMAPFDREVGLLLYVIGYIMKHGLLHNKVET
jgi:hypothetical protein